MLTVRIQDLQAHKLPALGIVSSFPDMAGYEMSAPSSVEKLMHLVLVLQLSSE